MNTLPHSIVAVAFDVAAAAVAVAAYFGDSFLLSEQNFAAFHLSDR